MRHDHAAGFSLLRKATVPYMHQIVRRRALICGKCTMVPTSHMHTRAPMGCKACAPVYKPWGRHYLQGLERRPIREVDEDRRLLEPRRPHPTLQIRGRARGHEKRTIRRRQEGEILERMKDACMSALLTMCTMGERSKDALVRPVLNRSDARSHEDNKEVARGWGYAKRIWKNVA